MELRNQETKLYQNRALVEKKILVDTLLLIPNIGPKVLNSVVKGDLNAFEVPLSYIGPLYYIAYIRHAKSIWSNLDLSFFIGTPDEKNRSRFDKIDFTCLI